MVSHQRPSQLPADWSITVKPARHHRTRRSPADSWSVTSGQSVTSWPVSHPRTNRTPADGSVTSGQVSHQQTGQSPADRSATNRLLSHQRTSRSPADYSVTSRLADHQLPGRSSPDYTVTSRLVSHQRTCTSPADYTVTRKMANHQRPGRSPSDYTVTSTLAMASPSKQFKHQTISKRPPNHLFDVLGGILLLVDLSTDGATTIALLHGGRKVGGCCGHVIVFLVAWGRGRFVLLLLLLLKQPEHNKTSTVRSDSLCMHAC